MGDISTQNGELAGPCPQEKGEGHSPRMLRSEDEPAPVGSLNVGDPLAKLHENDGFSVRQTLSLSTELVRRRPPPMLAT